jgi:hypothetical protein
LHGLVYNNVSKGNKPMGDRLTDAELIYRLQVLKQNGSQTKAALELKLNRASFRESLAEAKQRGLTAESRIKDPLGEARNEVKRLKAQIAVIHKHNDSAEEIRRVIYGLQEIPAEPPEWTAGRVEIEGPGTPMMMWSDWHYGEVVNKQEVGGLNEFNSEIADSASRACRTLRRPDQAPHAERRPRNGRDLPRRRHDHRRDTPGASGHERRVCAANAAPAEVGAARNGAHDA